MFINMMIGRLRLVLVVWAVTFDAPRSTQGGGGCPPTHGPLQLYQIKYYCATIVLCVRHFTDTLQRIGHEEKHVFNYGIP